MTAHTILEFKQYMGLLRKCSHAYVHWQAAGETGVGNIHLWRKGSPGNLPLLFQSLLSGNLFFPFFSSMLYFTRVFAF